MAKQRKEDVKGAGDLKREASGGGEVRAGGEGKKAEGYDRPRTSGLLEKGGKVSRSGLFHAAEKEAEARRVREVMERPREAVVDEDLLEGEGAGDGEGAAANVQEIEDDDGEVSAGGSASVPALAAQRVAFKLKRDLNKRLDKYLTDRITFMSRSKLQELIEGGGVRVNGRGAKSSTCLRQGDLVEVLVPPPASADVVPEEIPLEVMFEDEHMVVVNKSPDIIVHPARAHNKGTMINALAWHFRNRSPSGGGLSTVGTEFARPGVVHRLDRQTSGVIVFAKTEQAHWRIAQQFEARTTDKRYVALVHGRIVEVGGRFDEPLGPSHSREKGSREKQVVRRDELGKPALTVYRVLGRYQVDAETGQDRARKDTGVKEGAAAGAGKMWVTLVEVELKTGRTHQIRVHFSHAGRPLVGDDLYGGVSVRAGDGEERIGRVALHAAMLTFRHPVSNEVMRFVAPLAADLRGAVRWMRGEAGAEEIGEMEGRVLGVEGLVGEE
ncbi:hypothetical protein BH11PLA1_BH11PLA1_03800 [soil metagenome]